jgi:hypothetical protein
MKSEISFELSELAARARDVAQHSVVPYQFKALPDEQARRAVYFVEMSEAICNLGLSNAFERSALSVEPPHPVPPSRIEREIVKQMRGRSAGSKLRETGLSLASLPMLAAFASNSEPYRMLDSGQFRSPLYLLDELYGIAYFPQRDGQFHNHCFAIDLWQARLDTMPASLSQRLWRTRADSMMSGGALAGRQMFKSLVPPEIDDRARSQVAELVVHSESQLLDIASELRTSSAAWPDTQIWFRGQGSDYQVPKRDALIRHGLMPYSNIEESSLVPSMYRHFDDHLFSYERYEALLSELTEWIEASKYVISSSADLSANFSRRHPHALSGDGLTSFQRGLVLQQYGAPSAYLDITSDPMVAAWFATHACMQSDEGVLNFSARNWRDQPIKSWPTIFVFPLLIGGHPFLDLASILPNDIALRPSRQSCGLIGGAGNLARNYCARYVGLKLRLHPDFRLRSPAPASHLFPPDAEDPAMLRLRSLGLNARGRRFPLTSVCCA